MTIWFYFPLQFQRGPACLVDACKGADVYGEENICSKQTSLRRGAGELRLCQHFQQLELLPKATAAAAAVCDGGIGNCDSTCRCAEKPPARAARRR